MLIRNATANAKGGVSVPSNPYAGTTLNPADKSPNITLSADKLTATQAASAAGWYTVRSTAPITAPTYFEVANTVHVLAVSLGADDGASALDNFPGNGADTHGVSFPSNDGNVYWKSGGQVAARGLLGTWNATGNVAGCAIKPATKEIWFRNVTADGGWNGYPKGDPACDPATGTGGLPYGTELAQMGSAASIWACVSVCGVGDAATVNFGATAFVGAVPSGFSGSTGGGGTGGGTAPPEGTLIAANDVELYDLMRDPNSANKTIQLVAGQDYGDINGNSDFSAYPVTIQGAPGAKAATLYTSGGKGYVFKGPLNIYGPLGTDNFAVGILAGSSDITLDEGVTYDSGRAEGVQYRNGIFIRDSNNVTVRGQRDASKPDIFGRFNAVQVMDSTNVNLLDLTVSNNGRDGILVSGGAHIMVNGILGGSVYGVLTGPDPDHPDFIQVYGAADEVDIQNCGFQKGTGDAIGAQGYFIDGGCTNVRVKHVWSYCGLFTSAGFAGGHDITLDDAYFVGDATYGSAVSFRGGIDTISITNVYAGSVSEYMGLPEDPEPPCTNVTLANNTVIGTVVYGDYTGLDAWLATRPGVRVRR